MNNVRYRPASEYQTQASKSPQSARLILHFPLLCAALGAIVAIFALLLGQQIPVTFLNYVFFTLLPALVMIVVILYAAYLLNTELKTGWQDRQEMIEICNTLLLAGFLMGMISLLYITLAAPGLPLAISVASVILSVLSLAGLLVNVRSHAGDTSAGERRQANFEAMKQIEMLENELAEKDRLLQNLAKTVPDARFVGNPIAVPQRPESRRASRADLASDLAPVPSRPAQPFTEDPQSYSPPPLHRTRLFTVSKTNSPDQIQNEDICVISPNENAFALCDGASGSQLPRPWGFFLGQQWMRQPLYDDNGISAEALLKWLEDPRQNWMYWAAHSWHPSQPVSADIMNRILNSGAAATLVGLRIDNTRWYATAVGDTCLFHISGDGTTQQVMPLTRSNEFTQTPALLASRGNSEQKLAQFIQCKSSVYRRGDILLMATDALARWILLQHERSVSPWQQLLSLKSQAEFEAFIAELRHNEQIEVDDTTMVVIQPRFA